MCHTSSEQQIRMSLCLRQGRVGEGEGRRVGRSSKEKERTGTPPINEISTLGKVADDRDFSLKN